MSYSTLIYEVCEGVLTMTLNRPDQLNAFTVEMAHELTDAFESANRDDSIGAIIVTGAGRAFCAGMDLRGSGNPFGLDPRLQPDLQDLDEPRSSAVEEGVRDTAGRVALSIYECTKPVIAAINGPAVGAGATITLPMDFRLASPSAKIGFVFGKLGIVPEGCSTWFLPRLVGLTCALEWAYRAELISAEEALSAGLVKDVVPAAGLLDSARRLAVDVSERRSKVATALTRQMLYRNSAAPHPLYAHKIESLAVFYTSLADGAEGVRAFREKREPRFVASPSTDMPPFYPWWKE